MLFDTHAHMDDRAFNEDREQLLAGSNSRAAARAAERPVAISADDFDDED